MLTVPALYPYLTTLFILFPTSSGLEPGAARVTFTPPNMLDKAAAMSDLQFKEFMNPSEHFQVGRGEGDGVRDRETDRQKIEQRNRLYRIA